MAAGAGWGFDLSNLEKEFDKLDKYLKDLLKDGKNFSTTMNTIFKNMGKDGLNDFSSRLNELRKGVVEFGKQKVGVKWDSAGLQKYIDDVNRLLYVIKNVQQQTKKENIKGLSNYGLNKELKDAMELLRLVKRTEKDIATTTRDKQQTYSGALKYSANVKNLEQERQAVINLEAARDKLKKTDADYANKLNTLNEAILRHEKNLKDATKTDQQRAEEARKASEKIVEAQRKERAEYERRKTTTMDKWYSSSSSRALNFSANTKTLEEEARAIKYLEAARAKLNTQDANYKRILATLNAEIKKHKHNLDEAKKGAQDLQEKHRGLMDTSGQLARAIAAVFSVSAIKGYVDKLMQIRGEFELQQRSLQVLLQNKDEANALWNKTVALAVKSPYTTKQLVTATKQLAAYRIESEKLYETNKMLADVSIGLGVDMNRLILAFGQVKAANFLRGTELRQFSEAGINMLDELAKRFTMLEGRAVSVGEVFERISKRIVSFKDVEAIFKTITSEGGTFYQMQEKQSETLKGMMLNLKDSYELALNDMGKTNEDVLKSAVSTVKVLVDNWKTLSEILKAAVPLFGALRVGGMLKADKIKEMAIDFGVLTDNIPKQLKPLQLLELGWKRVTTSVKSFTKSLALNPWLLAITAVAYVVTKLVGAWRDHQKQLEEVEKKYQEIRDEVASINVNFTYADNKDELEKEFAKMQELAKRFKIYVNVDFEEMTIDQIKQEFANLQNQVLEASAFVNKANKAAVESDSWYEWGHGFEKDMEQAATAASKLSQEMILYTTNVADYLIRTGQLSSELAVALEKPKVGENMYDYIKRVGNAYNTLYEDAKKAVEATIPAPKTQQEAATYVSRLESGIKNVFGKDTYNKIMAVREGLRGFVSDEKEARKEFDEFVKKLTPEINTLWNKETLTKNITTFIDQKELDETTRELWMRFAQESWQIEITPKAPDKKQVTGWMKDYNDFVQTLQQAIDKEGNTLTIVKPLQADDDPTEYLNKLKGAYERLQKDIEAWDAGNAKARAQYNEDEIKAIKAQNAERKKAIDWLEYDKKKNKKEESEELKKLKKQIQLVRQLADDYEEMWKKYGKAYADANIKSIARKGAFDEFELDIDDFLVGTRQDEKNNLGKLLEKAIGIEGGKVEVEKAVADVEVEVRWDLQEQANANLSREFENLFGNYELSLELEKLNIPPDLANQLFGIDSIDLTTLRKELLNKVGLGDMVGKTNADILNSNAYKNLNEHQRKELANHLQKVSQMEQKEQEERLKKYSKYLTKGMDERVRIKIEELRKLEEVEKDKDVYTQQQLADIRKAIQKETQEELDKQSWDDFKNTDLYISLFEDLENASNQSLNIMIDRLQSLRESLNNLPPEQLKEIVNQLEKAKEELEGRNPFKKFGNDLKDYFGNIGKRKEAKTRIDEGLSDLKYYEEQAEAQREIVIQLEGRIRAGEKLTEQEEKNLEKARFSLKLWKDAISNTKKGLSTFQQTLDDIKKGADGIGEAFKDSGEFLNSMGSYISDMANKWEQAFGLSDKAKADIEAITGAAQAAGDVATGIGQMVGGDYLGGAMNVLSGIMSAFATAGKYNDDLLQLNIDAEVKSVKRLQKAYEGLEEQIKNTYDISELNSTTEAAQNNLLAQINATERMINAEENKKKSDQDAIDGYKDEIDNLKKQYKELEETRLQELGAFATDENKKSGAKAFLDAWMEAYKQTGDGLSGLNEQFDEFFEDSVKRQMLQKATSKYLDNLFNKYDSVISDWAEGDLTDKELNEKLSGLKNDLPALNENLKKWAEATGVAVEFASKNADLSGLQAGIQGITEDQADILAAYWSNVSLYTQDTNQKVNDLVTKLFSSDKDVNPMLSKIQELVNQTTAIKEAIVDFMKGGTSYVRVQMI